MLKRKSNKVIKAKLEELLSMNLSSDVSRDDLLVLISWISSLRWVLGLNDGIEKHDKNSN